MHRERGRRGRGVPLLILMGLLALPAGAGACSGVDSEAETRRLELEQRRRRLRTQFASVQSQIRRTQAAALDDPGVKAAQADFYAALRARMIEIDPGAEELLDQARDVGAALEWASGPMVVSPEDTAALPTREDMRRAVRDFQEVERALRAVEGQALRDSAVAARLTVLQDSLVAAMLRIDPGAAPIVEEMRSLESRIAEVDRALDSLRR